MGNPIIHSTKHGLRRRPEFAVTPTASIAVGVGKSPFRAMSTSPGRTAAPGLRDLLKPPDVATGVGSEKEDSITEVRGADGCRRNVVPFRSPPALGQRGEDSIKPARGKEAWDVLHEEVARSNLANDPPDFIPEPSLVGDPPPLAGEGVGLAGESSSDEIHRATPRATVKRGEIVPDRRRIQGRVFHPRHESGRTIGLPLDNAHKEMVGSRHLDSEVEPADAGAKGEGT